MSTEIYIADWIIPVADQPIKNGAMAVENDRIIAVGSKDQILRDFHGEEFVFDNSVIAPSWVNAHCHLELSYYHNAIESFHNFVDWVEQLILIRQNFGLPDDILQAVQKQMKEMTNSGTALVGDVTNGFLLENKENSDGPKRVVFYEILGLNASQSEEIYNKAKIQHNRSNPNAHISPHAPYSESSELFRKIINKSNRISVHLAESPEESRFIQDGTGPFREFLNRRKLLDEKWSAPANTPVAYLHSLGVLKPDTLLVHGVQVSDQDIEVIKSAGSSVCVCPRSNAFLDVGEAPVRKYINAGVPLCVGTDSLASNFDLDVLNELRFLKSHSGIKDSGMLIKMGTLNGARALGKESEYGSIEAGKKARFNIFIGDDAIDDLPEDFIVNKEWSQIRCS
ncbi:MAG: amidohydrolase family protein [Calditrichaceae bacterium]